MHIKTVVHHHILHPRMTVAAVFLGVFTWDVAWKCVAIVDHLTRSISAWVFG